MATTVSSIVTRQGRLTNHPLAGMFRMWLRGRKPSAKLACEWLNEDVGMLLSLQHDVNERRLPEFRTPATIEPYRKPATKQSKSLLRDLFDKAEPVAPPAPCMNDLFDPDDPNPPIEEIFAFWAEQDRKERSVIHEG